MLPRELDKNQKSYCLFPMMVTLGGGERRGTTGACWLTWCRRASGRQSRRHLPGKPSRDGNALTGRGLTLTIKCFDLSLSWFLEVPRADLSVPPHLLPSTPPAFVSYTVYKVYLGLVLLSVHASTSLEEDHGYVSVDLPKSRKGE